MGGLLGPYGPKSVQPIAARLWLRTAPATLAQRIVRAKAKIHDTAIPYDLPEPDQLVPRLYSVPRGCEEHGVAVDFRPPGTPRYGGHMERLIGTHMNALHVVDGSTGSSIGDRQRRDAQARASLTMRELERWLVLEIAGKYHHKVHAAL